MMAAPMAELERLLQQFAAELEAAGRPDPAALLAQVEGAERQELAERLDRYLMQTPRRRWDPVAYEGSAAKLAVDRVYESLEGVSGSWPELLPHLRNRARIRRRELVERLAVALGVGGAAQVEKVADYYNRMEHGLLPASGVSGRVIEALAEIVGVGAEAIRSAGAADAGERAGGAAAFARTAVSDPDYAAYLASDEPALGQASSGAPERRDAVDELFTGG